MTVSLKGPTGPGGSGKVVAGLGAVVGVGPDGTVVEIRAPPDSGPSSKPDDEARALAAASASDTAM